MQLTKITHLQLNQALASTNELEGSQAHSSMVTKSLEVLNLSQDQASLLFIYQYPFIGLTTQAPDAPALTEHVWSLVSGALPSAMGPSHLNVAIGTQWLST